MLNIIAPQFTSVEHTHGRLDFKGFNEKNTYCAYDKFFNVTDGNTILLFIDSGDNTSVTNAAESAISAAMIKFGITDVTKVRFFETYPYKDTADQIVVESWFKDSFEPNHITWKHLSEDFNIDKLFKQLF